MDYLDRIEQYRDEMTEALCGVIRIKSTKEDPCVTQGGEVLPFGRNVEDAYQYFLELGRNMGFEVADFDHYGGHIEWKSDEPGAKVFGISGHVDVVPEGDGWTHGAYDADVEDGFVYGRGTTDDKGPLLECLYAMKALRDSGMKPSVTIRLILGLDEETGKGGMKEYIARAGEPDFGITPDGDFPLVNGEMGLMIFDLIKKLRPKNKNEGLILRKVEGGNAPNIVPRECKAIIASTDSAMYGRISDMAKLFAEETGYNISVRKAGTSIAVETTGVAAHGATPEAGLNAISIMMAFLGRLDFAGDDVDEFIEYYNDHIGFNLSGENCGCGFEDEQSGKLIFNVGMIELSQEMAALKINIRYPVTFTDEQVYEGIEGTLEGTEIGILKAVHESPVFLDLDSDFAKKLMDAYVGETGDTENQPMVMGGGTYAKVLKNTVAYGALFPGAEDRMHQADERIAIDDMIKAARVYARAIKSICE